MTDAQMKSQAEQPFDTRHFKKTLGCFPTGIAIATTLTADNRPSGLTISSFNSVSLEPPLILFSIDLSSTCLDDFRSSERFAINILHTGQKQLCLDFSTPDFPRFEKTEYHISSHGVPLLADTAAYLSCAVEQRIIAGDHQIYIGRVLACDYTDKTPLLYGRGEIAHFPE